MRWVWRAESGAGAIEYGALVVLAGALAAALIVAGIPSTLTTAVSNAVCELYSAGYCDDTNGSDASGDGNGDKGGKGGPGGKGGGNGTPPGKPVGDSNGNDSPTAPTQLDKDLAQAQQDYDDLAKEQRGEKGSYDKLDEQLLGLLGELIGLDDAKKCFLEGDIKACLWTAVNALPWGKALKFVSKIPKAFKLFDKWRKGSKALNKVNEKVRKQKEKLDDLKKKKAERDRKKKKDPSCPVGGKPNSFPPGTPVLLADGTRVPIADFEVGDEVLAFDPRTGEEGPRPVTDLIHSQGEKTLVEITVTDQNGDTGSLTATDAHPFWTPETARWTDAADLGTGTWLRTADGSWAQVSAVDVRTVADQPVNNLTIAGLHTYYVMAGADALLVHNDKNDDCGPPLKSLHPDSSLDQSSLDFWSKKDTDDIVASLRPGADESLKVKPDGTIMNGNTRIAVLRKRGYDIDSLPREPYGGKPMTDEDFWNMD